MEAAQPICIAFSNADVSKSEVLISSNAIGVTGGNEGIITIPRFAGDWGVYRIVFFDKGLSVNAIVWFWVNSNTILRYGINGVSNGSKNTIINLSNLEKNRHYLVILACGHVQDDYCITAIGHAYRDIKYIAFSLNEIFSDNAFGIAWKQNGLNVTITTKSSGNIAPQGTLVFIWNSKAKICTQQIYAGAIYKDCNDLPVGESAIAFRTALHKPQNGDSIWFIFCMGAPSDGIKYQVAIQYLYTLVVKTRTWNSTNEVWNDWK